MAGHSKWANIQYRKRAQDARRGKLFTKLIREITSAARAGGGADPLTNPRLRTAIDKALAANMTRDTIERAARRGGGGADENHYENVRYEGYGPGGVAVMVDCLTDNRNRTVAEVRHLFSKAGGNLGTDGSVGYLFTALGSVLLPLSVGEDRAFELGLEVQADDVVPGSEGIELIVPPDALHAATDAVRAAGIEPLAADAVQRAQVSVSLDTEKSLQVIKLLEALEDLDDVQQVYSNAEFSDEAFAALT